MSTPDHITVPLANAEKTASAGLSLASTLYATPSRILLEGPLGAGKTTFVQGLAAGLGIGSMVNSPTFALEQRHAADGRTLSHIDLYRLDAAGAKRLVEQELDDADVYCIEWADRLEEGFRDPHIRVALEEDGDARRLTASFGDIALPADADIDAWRDEVMLPEHIRRHCDLVAETAARTAAELLKRGILCRPDAVRLGGRVHDLLRFVDFKAGAGSAAHADSTESRERWSGISSRYPGMNHEEAVAVFLSDRGFPEFARIVRAHAVHRPPLSEATIDQLIVFYADKRVAEDRIVSVDEWFEDFRQRYSGGLETDQSRLWHQEALLTEKHLFPDSVPF